MTTYTEAMNRLCKWRNILVGWMLGTKAINAPGVRGYRDLVERQIIFRAEINALTRLLLDRGVFTTEEFQAQMILECEHEERNYQQRFPGMRADDTGIVLFDVAEAAKTMKRLGFPE